MQISNLNLGLKFILTCYSFANLESVQSLEGFPLFDFEEGDLTGTMSDITVHKNINVSLAQNRYWIID